MNVWKPLAMALLCVGLGACTRKTAPDDHGASSHREAAAPSNRIAVPAAVRQNLGISFAKVEQRSVRQTLRIPGEFELRPEARREYRAMIGGRVNLKVRQFEKVTPETLLFTIDSPQWREMQHEAVEAAGRIKIAQAALDVAIAQQKETQQAADFIQGRIASLEQAQTRNVQLEAELAQLRNQLPRLAAEIEAKRVELTEAETHHRSRLRSLSAVTGMSFETQSEPIAEHSESPSSPPTEAAFWLTLDELPVLAGIAGVVSAIEVTNGGWIETGGLILSAADPNALRFRAHALQSDMARLMDGQLAHIVPPQGGTLSMQESIEVKLSIGFEGSPNERTIPVYGIPSISSAWSKPGVSAFLEVFTSESDDNDLAIPTSAVIRDGLSSVVFRRDPKNPDQVIRMDADLGTNDGRWIVVKSGLKTGDEVVVDGAYQLMLASSGSAPKGGHFHADGTFHEGED